MSLCRRVRGAVAICLELRPQQLMRTNAGHIRETTDCPDAGQAAFSDYFIRKFD